MSNQPEQGSSYHKSIWGTSLELRIINQAKDTLMNALIQVGLMLLFIKVKGEIKYVGHQYYPLIDWGLMEKYLY
ncbi:hypothetical protein ACQCT5_02470 [Sutcliffiella halmapala]